jgi:long-subunit fatty acid transport protein
MLKRISFVLFFLSYCSAILYADFFNNRNILLGERAALMGGAYTALSDDVSGAYYNPAGMAFIDKSTLSVNANIYRYQDSTLKIRQSTPIAFYLNHNNKNLLFLPSSFGMAVKVGDAALAFSVFQIDRFKVSSLGYVDYSGERKVAKLELDSASYLIGPSLVYRISDFLSAGLSCFYHYSSAEYTFSQELPGLIQTSIAQVETKSSGITGVFGIRASIASAWRLGIMYGTETHNLDGENMYSYVNTQIPYSINREVDGDIRLPHRTALGIAYEKKRAFTLALDVIYYFRMEYSAPYEIAATEDPENNEHKEKAHLDFSLGGELYLTDIIALRAGFFTNTSGATKQNGQSRVNLYGGTLGVALITGDVTTSIGTNMMYGKSDYTKNYPSTMADPASSWERLSVSIVVGSTARF